MALPPWPVTSTSAGLASVHKTMNSSAYSARTPWYTFHSDTLASMHDANKPLGLHRPASLVTRHDRPLCHVLLLFYPLRVPTHFQTRKPNPFIRHPNTPPLGTHFWPITRLHLYPRGKCPGLYELWRPRRTRTRQRAATITDTAGSQRYACLSRFLQWNDWATKRYVIPTHSLTRANAHHRSHSRHDFAWKYHQLSLSDICACRRVGQNQRRTYLILADHIGSLTMDPTKAHNMERPRRLKRDFQCAPDTSRLRSPRHHI